SNHVAQQLETADATGIDCLFKSVNTIDAGRRGTVRRRTLQDVRFSGRMGCSRIVEVCRLSDEITLLDEVSLDGGVWDDPTFHQKLTASRAAGLEPLLVQP